MTSRSASRGFAQTLRTAGLGLLLATGLGATLADAQGVLGTVRQQERNSDRASAAGPGRSGGAARPPVTSLPPGYRTYRYGGHPYYYGGGRWYSPGYGGYAWIAPPVGLIVDVLPYGYSTVWIGGSSYYYLDDVYYTYRPNVGYVVVSPPAGASQVTGASTGDDLFVYPKNGQSEAQTATDRYECHRWAQGQTGFDPTQPAGGVAASQTATLRAEYQRAMKACLEGRGYTVG